MTCRFRTKQQGKEAYVGNCFTRKTFCKTNKKVLKSILQIGFVVVSQTTGFTFNFFTNTFLGLL